MIKNNDINKILNKYDLSKLAIATLGSHSSLNIFKGAKEEGFRTVCICKEKDVAERVARWLEENYVQNEEGFVHVCRLNKQGSKVTGSEL